MANMVETLLDKIGQAYPLTEIDNGEYHVVKAGGIKFTIRSYYAKGLGHVSVMIGSGMLGLMKMDTLMVTPFEKDMPLMSYDRIHALGNDTLIYELYDTYLLQRELTQVVETKTQYAALPDHDLGQHWYDGIKLPVSVSKKTKKEPKMDELALAYMDAYLADAQVAAEADKAQKIEKSSMYVNGLLSNGGPSTDVFKKTLGVEKTTKLFKQFLFGIE